MNLPDKTVMSLVVLLSVIFFQSVCGTYFPPVNNAPPIPGHAVRVLDNSPQQIYVQEVPGEPQESVVNEGLFPSVARPDEQRWFIQENQSEESGDIRSSVENFDRFYPNGEPAIGPVATPMPDDTYVAEPSSISKVNPNDAANSGPSDIWVLTRNSDNQYIPERWVQIQGPPERIVEVVNQETGPVLATDTVKSVAPPVPAEIPLKNQFSPDPPARIVQQVWIRAPEVIGSQKVYTNPATVVEEVAPVKQIVEISQPGVKQVVQQPIAKTAFQVPPPPPPPKSTVVSKSSFTVPPPPPPPLKGGNVSPKVFSSVPANVVPDANVLSADKNGLLPQIRHIWIPTSARTGKFISVPVSPVLDSGKSVGNKGIPLGGTPVAVSDTWVLKQDGPVPSFEPQKSPLPPPPPPVQKGKIVIQDPPILQTDAIPVQPVIAQVDSPKNSPVVGKSIDANLPVDIWPPRRDIVNSKVLGKSPVVISELAPPPKTETVVRGKSISTAPILPQKSLTANLKTGPFPPPVPSSPGIQVINGKPCPIPLPSPQKSLFPPSNPSVIAVPRIIATQRKQPLTRIIRVNRYPTGSYYLLNSRIRPSVFTYSNPTFIRQPPKPRLIRLVQTKQIPIQVQSKPALPVQTKQISIPVQAKQIPAPVPARQVLFPFSGRQLIIPAAKSQNRIIYPGLQAVRYAYPWNAYLKSNPVPGKRVIVPQLGAVKKASLKKKSKSDSSSSESSSSEGSSESSKKEKEEIKKEEKKKKEEKEEKSSEEEKPESEESSASDEREREEEEETELKSSESEESVAETQPKESIETAESQVFQTQENLAILKNEEETLRRVSKPYIFRFDHRDGNGTIQHRQEMSDAEGRVSGTYGYLDPEGVYRHAKYVADSEGFRVNLESNEPGTVTHESAHANFISNQAIIPDEKTVHESVESTDSNVTTDFQRD